MSAPTKSMEGIVLNREETGESYLRLNLFSGEIGLKPMLLRLSKKKSKGPAPDLFDDLEVILNLPKNAQGIPFVKDYKIIRKRSQLAVRHLRFQVASCLSRLFLQNGTDLQDVFPFYDLLVRSLDSLTNGFDANCILFKTIFQFGRLEGLPVKESWLSHLSKKERLLAIHTLNRKLKDQKPSGDELSHLIESLREWLNRETELIC